MHSIILTYSKRNNPLKTSNIYFYNNRSLFLCRTLNYVYLEFISYLNCMTITSLDQDFMTSWIIILQKYLYELEILFLRQRKLIFKITYCRYVEYLIMIMKEFPYFLCS